jgi:thioesterase domain-containing protein
LPDAARRHLHSLALLRLQERLIYLLERVKARLKDRANNITVITKILKNVACTLYLGVGWRLPISLRSRYILEIYQQAKRNYVPEVYPGRLIMFKAAEGCPDPQTWEKLAAGGVEIHDIAGNHTDIVKEPYMRVWAEQLKVFLQRAQKPSSTEMNLALSSVITHTFE